MNILSDIPEIFPDSSAPAQDHLDAQYPDIAFFEYREKFVRHLLHGWRDYLGARDRKHLRCLDMGSNTGRYTRMVSNMGLPVEGVDFSEEMLALARSRHPDLKFHRGDAQALPFEDASFDGVVSLGLIQMVPDWRSALSETMRILKPGGMAVIETNRRFPAWEYWFKHAMYIITGSVGAEERQSVLNAHRMGPAAPNGSLRKFAIADLLNAIDGHASLDVQVHDPRKHGCMHDFVFALTIVKRPTNGTELADRVCKMCARGIKSLTSQNLEYTSEDPNRSP